MGLVYSKNGNPSTCKYMIEILAISNGDELCFCNQLAADRYFAFSICKQTSMKKNKNYYVVANTGFAHSRFTLKLFDF